MSQQDISSLNQLLENPDFIQWARGEKPTDNGHWRDWAANDSERIEMLENARQFVLSVQRESDAITEAHIQLKIRQALDIARRKEQEKLFGKVIRVISLPDFRWTAAASVLIILGIGLLLTQISRINIPQKSSAANQKDITEPTLFREVINRDQALKYVQLPDGSSVVLHKNSSIRYPRQFQTLRREVTLTGEAFFEITKNPEQPFFVYANELVAKVHGTSFSVKAGIRDKQVIVAVKTGKVSVFPRKDRNPGADEQNDKSVMVLTRNQQATFERNRAKLVRSVMRTPALLNIPIESQMFTYQETPVSKVFEILGGAYGVAIEFNKETMYDCSITATLGDEPLENKIKWICAILEAEYEIKDEKISIKGKSCR